ncbi:MAG: hypothetical protein KatS3mg002_0826 [Candidatus Woesearchaeota archaeon]|nr:MAG: hypothetical protein KatS3mg002_0826 [Candidatus Woesearchaeota archaeon]
MKKLKDYSPVVLRVAISLVFLWFSINQLISPSEWTLYLPGFLANTQNPEIYIYANAIFELIFGFILLIGLYVRLASLLLGIHLLGISVTLGWSAIAIRDYGLAFATLAIFLNGPDKLCVKKTTDKDNKKQTNNYISS